LDLANKTVNMKFNFLHHSVHTN